jgi:hypothetical protein
MAAQNESSIWATFSTQSREVEQNVIRKVQAMGGFEALGKQ